jgi:hypothetical protein
MLIADVFDPISFKKRKNPLIEDLLEVPSEPRVTLTRFGSPLTFLQ